MMCLRGDRRAFGTLMETHQRYAYALAFRILHDNDRAMDAVQESFVQVWKNLRTYREEIKFTTWLYKIIINRCYDKLKMDSRRHSAFGFFWNIISPDDVAVENDPYKDLERADLIGHILAASNALPPTQRLVFCLRDLHDFTVAEIAEYAGISPGAVKTNLHYARRRIRQRVLRLEAGD
jgi:RNA polymerase sigma-70 factor (ECF subfamily)